MGNRFDPHVESAGRAGRVAQGPEQAQAAIDGAAASARRPSASAAISNRCGLLQGLRDAPEKERQVSRAKAYEALAQRYPTDDEAQIFSALYLAGTQTQADQSYAAYLKAAAVLEAEFRKYPDHPGVAHYLIHSYDAPPIADKGLTAARRYATIAPDAPHACTCPRTSHARGLLARVRRHEPALEGSGQGGQRAGEAYHASDYMVYADLQLARDAELVELSTKR